ncbi:ribonuclease H-like protein [Delitschia confertaspora ATCC 74209]|uniref:Ribonuclease H-like protein n=1 Tax=Delitschia confertaspora ATCC 74209 TaxID=1513339 RepID=A0A9P4MTB7_9PLEO|nr:ribonuclease H-like protein [Delitschia confertaspora ATCC 74209]
MFLNHRALLARARHSYSHDLRPFTTAATTSLEFLRPSRASYGDGVSTNQRSPLSCRAVRLPHQTYDTSCGIAFTPGTRAIDCNKRWKLPSGVLVTKRSYTTLNASLHSQDSPSIAPGNGHLLARKHAEEQVGCVTNKPDNSHNSYSNSGSFESSTVSDTQMADQVNERGMSDSESPSDSDDSHDYPSEDHSENQLEEEHEEYAPLSFQIPPETLQAAMRSSPSAGTAYWRHDLYRGPDNQKIAVHYCRTKEVAERVARYFIKEPVLGFDIEWKPNATPRDGIKGNASLIQLASEDRIALFHIALFDGTTAEELLPPLLKSIMENPCITKVGVSIKADCTRLRKYLGLEAHGLLELSHLYKLVKFAVSEPKKVNKVLVSLAQQVEEHLQLPMQKGSVRSSDWSRPLDYEQIVYAASDGYAGLRVFDVLEGKRVCIRPRLQRPEFAELNRPIRLPESFGASSAEDVANKGPKEFPNEEEEVYETAVEEFSNTDTTSTESEVYIDDSDLDSGSDVEYEPPTRNLGRLLLSNATPVDPGYPTLPYISSSEDGQSDSFAESKKGGGKGIGRPPPTKEPV